MRELPWWIEVTYLFQRIRHLSNYIANVPGSWDYDTCQSSTLANQNLGAASFYAKL